MVFTTTICCNAVYNVCFPVKKDSGKYSRIFFFENFFQKINAKFQNVKNSKKNTGSIQEAQKKYCSTKKSSWVFMNITIIAFIPEYIDNFCFKQNS